jgi:hypothetical protein
MRHKIMQNTLLPPILAIDRARIDTLNLNHKFYSCYSRENVNLAPLVPIIFSCDLRTCIKELSCLNKAALVSLADSPQFVLYYPSARVGAPGGS